MTAIEDAKTEFRDLLILLRQNAWFNKICNSRQLEQVNATTSRGTETVWSYSIPKLEFKDIHVERHLRPVDITQKIKANEGSTKLFLTVACECNAKSTHDDFSDPIQLLANKIVINFEYWDKETEDVKVSQCSWHLDKHDPNKKTETTHPLYHYEFGGTEIHKTEGFNYGDFIIIDTPRIMHPPMDIVLGIDFVLKNYYKFEDHQTLTESTQYKKHIKNAQMRLWRPYAVAFASNFCDLSSHFNIDGQFAQNILHCQRPIEIPDTKYVN